LLPQCDPLVESASRSECFACRVAPTSVGRAHFAVGPFRRPCGIPATSITGWLLDAPDHSSRRVSLPPESRSRPILSRRHARRRTRDPLLSFRSLQHLPTAKVHSAGMPARLVPPSGFGYPPDGLHPSLLGRAYLIPAALVGFYPAELSPSER
jgi:hypothetical protein